MYTKEDAIEDGKSDYQYFENMKKGKTGFCVICGTIISVEEIQNNNGMCKGCYDLWNEDKI
jgi:hypothetical protein